MSESTNHLLHLLNDIERALVFLSSQPATREVGSQARNPNRPGSREPIDIGLLDVCTEVPAALSSWVRLVWEERDAEATADADLDVGPDGTATTQLCRWLRLRVTWIAMQPWVDEMLTELGALRHGLQRAPGSPLLREVVERNVCLQCEGSVVTRMHEVGDRVEVRSSCEQCGAGYDDVAITRAKAAQLRRLPWLRVATAVTTLTEEGITVTAAQIHNWADRQEIGRSTDDDGMRMYLLAEVRPRAERAMRWKLAREQRDQPAAANYSGVL